MGIEARRHLANLALYCYAAFIATVLAMPLLKDGYSPVEQPISEGAIGEHGFVQVLGLLALALGSFALAVLLRVTAQTRQVLGTSALVAVSAACVVGVALFPTDQPGEDSAVGAIHGTAAALAFITNIAAMLWSAHAFRGERALRTIAMPSLALGAVALTLLVMLAAGVGPVGVVQRATVACEMAWLGLVALTLRSRADDGYRTELELGPTGAAR